MRRPFSICAAAALAVLVVLAFAVVASAATPLEEYQSTGRITPCKYKPGQLGGNVPNDIDQYAPEYKAQLEAAARQRARGCSGSSSSGKSSGGGGAVPGGGSSGGGTGAAAGSPAPPSATPAAPPLDPTTGDPVTGSAQPATTGSRDAGTSAWLIVLLILGGLLLLAALLALVGRYLGWSPRWAAPAVHALREAGMRIGTTAGGVADWARPAPRSS